MIATATALRSVIVVYARPDGARVQLSYRETAHGSHRVTIQADEVAVWNCWTVEGARTRWRLLARRLRDNGFELEGRS